MYLVHIKMFFTLYWRDCKHSDSPGLWNMKNDEFGIPKTLEQERWKTKAEGARGKHMNAQTPRSPGETICIAVTMEVDEESAQPKPSIEQCAGMDSDDETLKFDKDDDLYDSGLDEDDARWVRKQHRPAAECGVGSPAKGRDGGDHRNQADDNSDIGLPPEVAESEQEQDDEGLQQQTQKKQGKGNKSNGDLGVNSDAQLSCPLCFTTVCLECQRHVRYHNQFRAVTGINITVKRNESLTFDDISGGGKRAQKGRAKGRNSASSGQRKAAEQVKDGGELFHPVCCVECDHRVGVLDEEEVFHFFGVIASG